MKNCEKQQTQTTLCKINDKANDVQLFTSITEARQCALCLPEPAHTRICQMFVNCAVWN